MLTHRHTAEMEQALSHVARASVEVLFTPHLVPTTRGILATCYARPRAAGLSTARLLEQYRAFYAADPCVVVVDDPSGTKATYGANVVHVTVRYDARTETVLAIATEDNLTKGASGQAIQAANLVLGLPGDHRLALARSDPVSTQPLRRASKRVGSRVGIKESGAPDLAIVVDRGPRARRCCRRLHVEPRAGGTGADQHRASHRRPRGRSRAQLRQRQRRDRGSGPERRPPHVHVDRVWPRRRAGRVLVCSTGLIGIPMPMAPIESGIPKLCAQVSTAGGSDAARAIMTTDTKPKEAVATIGAATVGGMAKGAAMLSPAMATMLAVVTTDAAIDRAALQRALARAVAESFDCLDCRRGTLHQRHRARARERSRRRSRSRTASPTRSPRCARRSPNRWRAMPKVRRSSCASASSAPAPTPMPASPRGVANSQLVQCSLNGADPYWGRILSELGASGALLDPERVDISYNGVVVCRDGIACDHDAAALGERDGRARHRDPLRPAPRARRSDDAHDRPVPRVHRREPADVVSQSPVGSAVPVSERVRDAGEKAQILSEALPYIREFSGRTVVIKYGGHAMENAELADLFATDVVLMRLVGMNPIVVHGGGPQITDLMRKLGKEPTFVDGRRVTDEETMDIVRMALVGKVNREIVASVNRHGSYAVGLSGEDAGLIRVDQRDPRLGFVGDVRAIDPTMVFRLLREELIPIIATVGVDDAGQAYNVNADTVAGAIAEAVDAEKLVYLTDVAGVYGDWPDETSLISRIDVDGLDALVASGKISDGMIPKLESCVAALRHGVRRAHILDGRLPHALLLEFFTREGVGTMVEGQAQTGRREEPRRRSREIDGGRS